MKHRVGLVSPCLGLAPAPIRAHGPRRSALGRILAGILFILAVACGASLHAQPNVWSDADFLFGDSLGDPLNWLGSLLPASGADISFQGSPHDASVRLPASFTVNSATFTGSTNFNISGSGTLTVNSSVTANSTAANPIVIAVPVTLGGNVTLTNDSTAGLLIQGNITGNGHALTIYNSISALIQLTGTYTGGSTAPGSYSTIISTGSFTVGAGGTGAGGAMIGGNVLDGGTLVFAPSSSDNLTYSGVISGTGGLTIAGNSAGMINLTGANTYSGGTQISSGILADGIAGAYSASSQVSVGPNGTLDVTNDETVAALSDYAGSGGTVKFSGGNRPALTISGTYGTSFSGTIMGAGSLVISGDSTIETLAGSNTYCLGTTIAGGLLIAANGSSGSATGTGIVTIEAGANLQIGNGEVAGTVSGNIIDNNSGGAYSGVDFSSSALQSYNGVICGPGGVTQEGSGIVTFGGQNTYGGNTYVIAGKLGDDAEGSGNNFSPNSVMILGLGALDVKANESIAGLADYGASGGGGTVCLSSDAVLTLAGASGHSYSGTINGAGAIALTNTGEARRITDTFSGANTYSEGTTIGSGVRLFTTNGFGSSATGTGMVTVDGGAILVFGNGSDSIGSISGDICNGGIVGFNSSADECYAGVISGTGKVDLRGSGTVTLKGANTYRGGTNVVNGTLADGVAGAYSASSRMSVGASGTVDVDFGETVNGLSDSTSRHGGATAGNVVLASGATLTLASAVDNTFSGLIGGSGALEVAAGDGGETFANINTYSGGTTIDAGGTLQLGNYNFNDESGASGGLAGCVVDNGTLILQQAGDTTYCNRTSGSGALVVNSSGNISIPNANAFTGGTTINNGTVVVTNTTGSALGTGPVVVGNASPLQFGSDSGTASTLGGTGSFTGALILNSGGIVIPGNLFSHDNAPLAGTLSVGATTFGGGSAYGFIIDDAAGAAGTNWSLLSVTGSLNITATSGSPFTIGLVSETQSNADGLLVNFNPATSYSWEIVSTTAGISGFAPGDFSVNLNPTSSHFFQNSLDGGSFSVSQQGNDLFLNFTPIPEPDTWISLLGGGIVLACLLLRRRRAAA